jgi:hypothetical protein
VQGGDDPADGLGGVLLDVAHVGLDDVQAEVVDHGAQLADAALVGGDLGAQVGQVGGGVAGRVRGGLEELDRLGFAQVRVLDQQPVVDQHPLLLDPGAGGRHGSGRDPADLGVVPARSDVKPDLVAVGGEHRGDDCDVREVSAAVVGVVEDVDVAAAEVWVALDHHLDRLAHRAQVDRHVRGVGDQAALRVEQRAGEVEPLLDVDRVRGGLQADAHLLGDRHEQVVEDLQHHRVGAGADGGPVGAGGHPGE